MTQTAALVLFSGGQDSTVCLAWALERYERVETVGFAYGQRHSAELGQRGIIREGLGRVDARWSERLGADHMLELPELGRLSDTALTRDAEIVLSEAGLPSTFVPGRNLLFFTYAAALAYRRGIRTLVGGMCETDYSGYPDCRNETIEALGKAISLGMDTAFDLQTPLMWIDKAATWALAEKLGGAPLVELIVEDTHTCYLGIRSRRHAWGYGCGHCPACGLRAKGWETWQAQKDLIRAVDLALAGDWKRAHEIAQSHEGEPAADWLHAVLHKVEGDESNARYWYRRTTHDVAEFSDPQAELKALRESISR